MKLIKIDKSLLSQYTIKIKCRCGSDVGYMRKLQINASHFICNNCGKKLGNRKNNKKTQQAAILDAIGIAFSCNHNETIRSVIRDYIEEFLKI